MCHIHKEARYKDFEGITLANIDIYIYSLCTMALN